MEAYNLMQFWTFVFLFCTSDASISITPYDSLIPNEMESLECNKTVTLSCVTPANTLSMSWKEEGTTVADCLLGTCTSTGQYSFTQDTSSGVFNLTLNPVLYAVHGNTFVCSAGVDSSTYIPDVKVMPDTATTTNSSSGLELEVTTGCVYPVSAITFKWYYMDNGDRKVLDNSVETEVSTGCATGNCGGLGVKRIKSTLTTDSDGEEYNIYVDVIHAGAPENDQNYVVSKSFGIFKVAEPPANVTIPTTTSPNTTTTPPSGTTQHPKTPSITVIIVLCVALVLLFAIPIIICVYLRYKRNQSKQKENPQSYTQDRSSKENKRQFSDIGSSDMKEHQRVTNPSTNRSNAYQGDITQTEQL